MMKVGKLGLSTKLDLESGSLSNCLVAEIPDSPRIYTSGIAFGSDPQALFSLIRKEGSKACIAFITLVFETFKRSSFFTITEFPVKLDFLIFEYPVTTTSSSFSISSSKTTFTSF